MPGIVIGAALWVLGYSLPHKLVHSLIRHIKKEAETQLCVG